MQVYGKIHFVDKKERLFSIVVGGNLQYFHLTNKNMRDFKNYLYKKPYVFFEASEEYSIHSNIKCQEVDHFIKVILPSRHKVDVYYDLHVIQDGVKSLINQEHNRLFLDLEFSLVSPGRYSVSEIVQYGMVLEDKDGNIIMEDASLVRPMYNNSLNKHTLSFLSRDISDFDNACSYIEFYQLLEKIIEEYNPKIYAWGRNDGLSLEKSFKLNHLHPLDIKNRYINLMQIIKNYYNYKQEMGLFNTYKEMTNGEYEEQIHDALEDAMIEREIFHLFKHEINKPLDLHIDEEMFEEE